MKILTLIASLCLALFSVAAYVAARGWGDSRPGAVESQPLNESEAMILDYRRMRGEEPVAFGILLGPVTIWDGVATDVQDTPIEFGEPLTSGLIFTDTPVRIVTPGGEAMYWGRSIFRVVTEAEFAVITASTRNPYPHPDATSLCQIECPIGYSAVCVRGEGCVCHMFLPLPRGVDGPELSPPTRRARCRLCRRVNCT